MHNSIRIFDRDAIYHICNKSISNYHIFRTDTLSSRFLLTLNYYNLNTKKLCLSKALKKPFSMPHILTRRKENICSVISFCIMPDHYHVLIKARDETFISKYINDVQNSFTRYYNKMNERKGPLWQSRFRAVHIKDNFTLLHVHRYIHLNPTTAGLVTRPETWGWSSYRDYISDINVLKTNHEISIGSMEQYKKFVEDQIDYQKTIKGIRRKLLE